MSLYINNTGKLFAAACAAWLGAKIYSQVTESSAAEADAGLQAALDRTIDESVQEDLAACAIAGDGGGFTALLDAHGCPSNPHLRARLWEHFGGD